MPQSYQRTTIIFPDTLLERARTLAREHRVKGGVTRLVCDALEAHLDALQKIPISFRVLFMRQVGRDATPDEKVRCYGGQWREPKLGGVTYTPLDWFTMAELRGHWATDTWDRNTARLIYHQQLTWLKRGQPLVQMPLTPPGWEEWDEQLTTQQRAIEGEDSDDLA